jgi:hypothetical protein
MCKALAISIIATCGVTRFVVVHNIVGCACVGATNVEGVR